MYSDSVAHFMRNGLIVKVEYDQDCDSPLSWDSTHITYNSGGREILGDEPITWDELEALMADKDVIWLPVQAYIHSGVALRATHRNPFPDPQWDSGMSGIVYLRKETIREDYGVKRISSKLLKRVYERLENTVETFSCWLNGECYGYDIMGLGEETLDSCWGFIGYDYALEEATGRAARLAEKYPDKCYPSHVDVCDVEDYDNRDYQYRAEEGGGE